MMHNTQASIHVLHVVPGLLPGGMELAMARVISGLSGNGMRHSVVCLKGEPEIADRLPECTEIHCMHARPNEPQLPARLARTIRQVRPTVIHTRNWGAWPDTAVGRLLTRPRAPLIHSFHGLGKAGYMPRRRRWASWALARMTTSLFTVSCQSRDMLVAHWGWPRHRVNVIPNGVDTERFRLADRHDNRERRVIGTVGNLRSVKNHALLVRACGDLLAQGVDLEVRIAGEGKQRENLTALAESSGLGERLKLVGRVEDVPGFLRDLDLFVLSSDSEQHPNALNEAMACGLPCVATRVGCVDELLDAGRCGKIVAPGAREEMAGAIRELILDPALGRRFAAAARQRAVEHYSHAKMLGAYEALYTQFANGRRGRP